MVSLSGINPLVSFKQNVPESNKNSDKINAPFNELKYNALLDDIPTDKVGTTSTKVARKGVKYMWQKFTNYLSEHFSNKNTEENNTPKYNYEA